MNKFNGIFGKLLFALAWASVNVATVHAAVTTQGFWRGGENDYGAVAGNVGNNPTQDRTVGNNDLARTGSPLYSANVPGVLTPNDTLSYQFTGADEYLGTVYTYTDNFGIEAWVNSSTPSADMYFMLNGTGANGYALVSYLGLWRGFYNGLTIFDGPAVVADTWVNLALVRDSGTTTFYVNGVASGVTSLAAPYLPTTAFHLGLVTEGLVDEARIFTFTPGAFSVSDLLLTQTVYDAPIVPEPTTVTLLALGLGVVWRRRSRMA